MGKINHENTKVRKHETRYKKKMNVQHPTSNIQHRMKNENVGDVATKLHYSDESLIPSNAVKKQRL